MKRQCDLLISIIERRKEELLDDINSEYNKKAVELCDSLQNCEKQLHQCQALAEFISEALAEPNSIYFMRVCMRVNSLLSKKQNLLFLFPYLPC